MSMTDPTRTDASPDPTRVVSARASAWRETKPSPKTTELWMAILGVVALVVIYNASRDASLDLFRACLLGIVLASAYIVSRGFAKAGSHDDDDDASRAVRRTRP